MFYQRKNLNRREKEMGVGSILFIFIYCVCLILGIINPVILIGSIPLRQLLILILLLLCFQYRKKGNDWFLFLYPIFMVFYFFAGINTGYGQDATKTIIGTYLGSIVLYWATTIMTGQFNKVNLISYVLLLVFVLDAVAAIGQYIQISFFKQIPLLLGISLKDTFERSFYEETDMEGVSMAGIVGPVINGFLLSAATILAWYPFKKIILQSSGILDMDITSSSSISTLALRISALTSSPIFLSPCALTIYIFE